MWCMSYALIRATLLATQYKICRARSMAINTLKKNIASTRGLGLYVASIPSAPLDLDLSMAGGVEGEDLAAKEETKDAV